MGSSDAYNTCFLNKFFSLLVFIVLFVGTFSFILLILFFSDSASKKYIYF